MAIKKLDFWNNNDLYEDLKRGSKIEPFFKTFLFKIKSKFDETF